MPSVEFGKSFLTDLLEDKWLLRENKKTGVTFDDGIIEEWEAVFTYSGEGDPCWSYFRFKYRQPSSYARSTGYDEGYFDHLSDSTVTCEKVFPREVVTIVYEPVPDTEEGEHGP